jgi:predicted HTH transcriptional regulator
MADDKDNTDNIYKLNTERSPFRSEIRSDLEQNMAKFNDPIVLGELMFKLLEERENTNRILKNILAKFETLETPNPKPASVNWMSGAAGEAPLLPEVDERILAFVKQKGRITAEEVRAEFKYKGKNAACARLNRLYELGLLQKKQVGKKVFFFPI